MRILIADDHPLYREAVRLRLQRTYPDADILEVADLNDRTQIGDLKQPLDLVLLDLHMPGIANNSELAHAIASFDGAPTILMSGLAEHGDVKAAISAGARGFLAKTMTPEQFSAALSIVMHGGTYLPAEMIHATAGESTADKPAPLLNTDEGAAAGLSQREKQVWAALARGATNKQIAREYGLAEVTIKLHLRQIFKKIGARNRAEAAVMASKAGLI